MTVRNSGLLIIGLTLSGCITSHSYIQEQAAVVVQKKIRFVTVDYEMDKSGLPKQTERFYRLADGKKILHGEQIRAIDAPHGLYQADLYGDGRMLSTRIVNITDW